MHAPRLALSAFFLSLVAALPVSAQTIADGPHRDGGGRRRVPPGRRHRRPPGAEMRALVRSLQITPQQRELVRAEAREAAPLVRQAHETARAMIERARGDENMDKRALRERLLALRDATHEALEP